MMIVPLSADECPNCQSTLSYIETDQPALFSHGGYGATEHTVVASCTRCGYHLHRERSETRP